MFGKLTFRVRAFGEDYRCSNDWINRFKRLPFEMAVKMRPDLLWTRDRVLNLHGVSHGPTSLERGM